MCRLRGKLIVQQELGTLRGYASQLAHMQDIDEEEFFLNMARNWLNGIHTETSKIFGADQASRFLDPFETGAKKDG